MKTEVEKRAMSCSARVKGEWLDRTADFELYMNNSDVLERGNDNLPSFNEYGLCFDYVLAGTFSDQDEGFFRYQLSTGGPGDELRFFADAALHVYKVEYWFLDWSDGASLDVTAEPIAKWLVEELMESGCFKAELEKALEA